MIIGLTGKSCSGKNFASEYMEKLGWKVLDLDRVAHDVLSEKSDEVLSVFGTCDRKELGKIVFNDRAKRTQLESILYPEVVQKILESDKKYSVVVANGALLHRAGIDRICSWIIYIDASFPVRCMRAIQRDSITEADFKLRDMAQDDVHFNDVKYESKLIVIDNNIDGSEELKKACRKISSDQGIL